MKRSSIIILTCILMATAAGCGGTTAASGPGAGPVDLPAPVVGRIDVGSPDASGKSSITGTAGAVEAGSIVMAINERLEVVSTLWKVTDALFPAAYAQSLPSVCSETGHFCTVAAADGSFEMQIDASIGDTIYLVLLDEDGNEISPRSDPIIIPATNLEVEQQVGECAGQGLVGTLKGMVNVGGIPVGLKEGDDQENNQLLVGPTTIPLPGCRCTTLDVTPPGTADGSIVALLEDGALWSARWDGATNLYAAAEATVAEQIVALEPMGDPDYMIAAFTTASGFAVGRLSLASGTIDKTLPFQDVATAVHDQVVALRTIGPFANNNYLGMLLVKSIAAGGTEYYVMFFDTINFDDLTFSSPSLLINPSILQNIGDAHLTIDGTTGRNVYIVLTDQDSRLLRSLMLTTGGQTLQQTPTINLLALFAPIGQAYDAALDRAPSPDPNVVPQKFSIGIEKTSPIAYILVDDPLQTYNVWIVADFAVSSGPQENISDVIPGATDPKMIAVDGPSQTVMVGDLITNGIISANGLWLSEVL